MDFEDPRLRNILKLKAEFEKELARMGKLKKKPSATSRKRDVKLKIDISPPANVKASDVRNILDINRQDYDADDAAVIKALKRGLPRIGDVRRRTLVEGILKLLEGDLESAKDAFSRFDTVDFKYMLGLTKLYSSDVDVLGYAVNFLKDNPKSFQPYLLMSEMMISLGRYGDAVKFLNVAKALTGDVYLDLVLRVYNGDVEAKKLFAVAVNRGEFRTLLAILSIYMEDDPDKGRKIATALRKRVNPCCRFVSAFWLSENPSFEYEKYAFCPRLTVMNWARKFEMEELSEDPRESAVFVDPVADLFFGIYSYSIGEFKSADEYFKRFSEKVENYEVKVVKSPSVVSKLGIRMFYEPVQGDTVIRFRELSSERINIALEKAKKMGIPVNHTDILVSYRDPEILRLFFGYRHCKFLYS